MSPDDFGNQLELFHGEATVRLARIYAQVPAMPGYKLSGYLSGPHCLHSTTLPATIPFRDKGPGATLLAEAILPDPCFWSPEMPALYTAQVELRRDDAVIATVQRTIGLRSLAIRGKSFYSDARRIVLRGMHHESVEDADLLAWRDAGATMLVADPADKLCDEASRVGVLLLALLSEPSASAENIRRLAMHAAVGALLLPPSVAIDAKMRQNAQRIILGRMLTGREQVASAGDADMLIVTVNDPQQFASDVGSYAKPVIALALNVDKLPLDLARGKCDELQARLAPYGDFAGYLI